jgi:metallo-beta-lactamase family protein
VIGLILIKRIEAKSSPTLRSGMRDAGRIKHHLKDHLWRGDSTVLFVGYQAPGTLGHLIRSEARSVRIHGEEIAVRARIRTLDLYSGLADRSELRDCAAPLLPTVGHVFLTHGEPGALAAIADTLAAAGLPRARLSVPTIGAAFRCSGWRCHLP